MLHGILLSLEKLMGVPSSGEYMSGSGIKIPATAFAKSIKVFFPLMIPFALLFLE